MKVLKIIIMLILVIIIGGVLYLGYLGFIPGISKLFGSDKPRNLGVKYTEMDYQSADSKAKVMIENIPSASTIKAGLKCEGTKDVKATFTQEELTAVTNTHASNWKYYPVSSAQIKINSDGSAAFSGILHIDRLAGYSEATGANYQLMKAGIDKLKLAQGSIPIYVAGQATVSAGSVNFSISQVELGRFNISVSMIQKFQGAVNNFFSQQVNAFPGFYIKSLDFKGGKMNFEGQMPEKVITAKN